jgi:transcriptional regulator with XRE-family HTH domain
MDRAHVGAFIRRGRALRRQPYHARPWTQDELAFAIGTDPAHISRIEGGKIVPSRATIDRIALAFELTPPQHALLLRLAGYAPEASLPDDTATQRAVAYIERLVRDYAHPVSLITNDLRLVYVNRFAMRLRGLTPEHFNENIRGHRLTEFHLESKKRFGANDPVEERDAVVRHLFKLLQLIYERSKDPDLDRTVGDLLQDELFRKTWDQATLELMNELQFSTEFYAWSRSDTVLGPVRFHRWLSAHPLDDRFLVCQDLPADEATRRAFATLAEP